MRSPVLASLISTSVLLTGFGLFATNTIKLPIVRDMEIVTQTPQSNWNRNQLMFEAEERCKMMDAVGGVMTVAAVRYHLYNATPTEIAKGLGRAYLATKHACKRYQPLFKKDFTDTVLSIHGWDEKEVYQVIGRRN